MKKSDIEKQIRQDLSASAPNDFDAVWNKCVTQEAPQCVTERVVVTAGAERTANGKSPTAVAASVVCAACVCIAIALLLIFLLPSGGLTLPTNNGYFLMDINPSVRVDYDTQGTVTSARGLNGDGEAILDGLDLDGKTYVDAATEIFDRCFERGYISAEYDDNAILMTANNSTGEKDDKITAALKDCLLKAYEKNKLNGVVISDVDNAKGQAEAEKFGINGQKYELIMHCNELGGNIPESEYATITIRELYKMINELQEDQEDQKDKDK